MNMLETERARMYLRFAFSDAAAVEIINCAKAGGGKVSEPTANQIRRQLGSVGQQVVDALSAGSPMPDRAVQSLSRSAGSAWVGPAINELLK